MLNTHISSIPCQIKVDRCVVVPGDFSNDSSDWDHTGYSEIEFTVCDTGGRPAQWLTDKMTDADIERIEKLILENRYAL